MTEKDVQTTYDTAERALGFAKVNGTPISPDHFEVWYTYAAGHHSQLNKDIRTRLDRKERLTTREVEELHRSYCSERTIETRVDTIGNQINQELSEILGFISTASKSTGDFGNTLKSFTDQIGNLRTPSDIKEAVTMLAAATWDMFEATKAAEEKLANSRQQIAELSADLEAVRSESLTDQLTGIANRKCFDRTMAQVYDAAGREGHSLTLLLIDIDHFKKFNDTHGHQTGDQVLRLVAQTLKGHVKGVDLAARYGGEEFAVILPRTHIGDAVVVADHLRHAVQNKELVKRSTNTSLGRITVSIGVATYRLGDTIDSLIERADKCLYAAKASGRNCVKSETSVADIDHAPKKRAS